MSPDPQDGSSPGHFSFLRDSSWTFLGMILWGIANYLVYAIAARVLDSGEFAAFVSWWAAMNIITVGLFAPFESLLPQMTVSASGDPVSSAAVRAWCIRLIVIAWVVGVAASYIVTFLLLGLSDGSRYLLPLAVLLFFSATTSAQRGLLAGARNFRVFFMQLACISGSQIVGLFGILLLHISEASTIVWVTAIAAAIGYFTVIRWSNPVHRLRVFPRSGTDVGDASARYVHLVVSTVASQGVHNLGATIAPRTGISSLDVGAYVGGTTLGRVPLMLINPLGAPLIPRLTQAAKERDVQQFRSLVIRACFFSIFVGAILVPFLLVLGNPILHLYLGSQFNLPNLMLGSIAVSTGLFLVASFLRFGLIAIQKTQVVAGGWIVALVTTVIVLVLPLDAWVRLSLATPVALSVLVAILCTPLLKWRPEEGQNL